METHSEPDVADRRLSRLACPVGTQSCLGACTRCLFYSSLESTTWELHPLALLSVSDGSESEAGGLVFANVKKLLLFHWLSGFLM